MEYLMQVVTSFYLHFETNLVLFPFEEFFQIIYEFKIFRTFLGLDCKTFYSCTLQLSTEAFTIKLFTAVIVAVS
jgi:hypothetical protein